MFHNTITILMTNAVMLHALLGCCAHHVHACDTHDSGHETFADEVSCSHGHNHHQHEEDSSSPSGSDNGRQDDHGDGHESCYETDCSFVSTESSDEITFAISFALWLPLSGDTTVVTTLHEPDCLLSGMTHAPDELFSEPMCAQTQVWLL